MRRGDDRPEVLAVVLWRGCDGPPDRSTVWVPRASDRQVALQS
jgi:hypothetical protein